MKHGVLAVDLLMTCWTLSSDEAHPVLDGFISVRAQTAREYVNAGFLVSVTM
jgi:hypothetical protein